MLMVGRNVKIKQQALLNLQENAWKVGISPYALRK